ncbi:MAG: hypothetical protein LBT42_03625 [Tannerella sp.]|nr:hypothetical protein [Tannerella sp.]
MPTLRASEAIQRPVYYWIASFLAMTASVAVSLRHTSFLLNKFSNFLAMTKIPPPTRGK